MAIAKGSVTQALQQASQGLLFRSETDAPFEAFEWPGEPGKPDKARVLELAGVKAGTSVKSKALASFFKDATAERDWHDEQEKGEVEKFKRLVQALKESLADVKVFQVGTGASDVYIVGRAEGGWAGLKTRVVET